MNIVDLVFIIVITLGSIDGFRRGLLGASVEFMGFILAVLVSYFAVDLIIPIVQNNFGISEGLAPFVAFVGIFFILDIAIGSILKLIYPKILKIFGSIAVKNIYTNIAGIMVHWVRDFILIVIAVNLLLFLPIVPSVRNELAESATAHLLITTNPILEGAFAKVIAPAVYELQKFVTTKTITDKPVDLDTPIAELVLDTKASEEMLALVNKEREKLGLKPLVWREDLAKVAQKHSRDMWERHYFGHINPDGEDPFNRLDKSGVKYKNAGENLAVAPSTPIAHEGLMDSPGHRENILRPEFGHIGIGVIRNGLYGAMYTQLFSD